MSKHLSISPLFCFPKCVVEEVKISIKAVQINIRYDQQYSSYCPVCKKAMGVNRRLLQTVRDLPLGEAKVVIISHEAIQCHCSSCGAYYTFTPEGIDMNARELLRGKTP